VRLALLATLMPSVASRLAERTRTESAAGGRFVLVRHGRGTAHLRYEAPAGDDRAACLQRQVRGLDVLVDSGATRATLNEEKCIARGDPACEYTFFWADTPRLASAAAAGLVAALLALSPALGNSAAAWFLVPLTAVTAYGVERRHAVRRNRVADAEAGETFRWALARALATRAGETVQADEIPTSTSRTDLPVLDQDGDFWRVGYEGTTVMLRHSRGLTLLAHLIRCPGVDIHVRDLDSITPSGRSPVATHGPAPDGEALPRGGDAGEVLDARARAEYRNQLIELRADLEQAEGSGDSRRAESIHAEIDVLAGQLRSAVGVGGRGRRASSDVERLRAAITRRIRAAIEQIAKHHPALGAHLTANVSTGYFCSYVPRHR